MRFLASAAFEAGLAIGHGGCSPTAATTTANTADSFGPAASPRRLPARAQPTALDILKEHGVEVLDMPELARLAMEPNSHLLRIEKGP
jgi:hypothetical protein